MLLNEKYADEDIIAYIKGLRFDYNVSTHFPAYPPGRPEKSTVDLMADVRLVWPLFRQRRFDLIVFSVGTPGSLLGNLLLPTRVLYILHTYPTSAFIETHRRKLLLLLLGRYKRLVTVSAFSRQNILSCWKLAYKAKYVEVVHNAVDAQRKPAPAEVSCPQVGMVAQSSGAVRITTLGHVESYKNPFTWIEAARQCLQENPSVKMEFIWAGEGSLLMDCRERVKAYNLEDSILFMGLRKDVTPLLAGTDIYFQPSLVESFGLSVVEAMASRIPCVVSDRGGLPEVVQNGVTGFVVDPEQVSQMVGKLNILVQDKSLRRHLGEAGYERYRHQFSMEVWEHRMLHLHQSLL